MWVNDRWNFFRYDSFWFIHNMVVATSKNGMTRQKFTAFLRRVKLPWWTLKFPSRVCHASIELPILIKISSNTSSHEFNISDESMSSNFFPVTCCSSFKSWSCGEIWGKLFQAVLKLRCYPIHYALNCAVRRFLGTEIATAADY